MQKLFNILRAWLASLAAPECTPDPLAMLAPRDWADLPAHHPQRDYGCF